MTNIKLRISCWTVSFVRDGKSSQKDLHCFTEATFTSNYPKPKASSWQEQEGELTARFPSTLSVVKSCQKSVHVPFCCVSRVNQKGDSTWKQAAEAASPKNGVNFLWWGCSISHVIHVMADIIFLLFKVTFWVCQQCYCLLFILLSPPLLFLGATVSERQDSEIPSVITFVLWHNLSWDKAGWDFFFLYFVGGTNPFLLNVLFQAVSQITTKAQSFWAAEALLLLPT